MMRKISAAVRENITITLISLPNDGVAPIMQVDIDEVPHHGYPMSICNWSPLIWFEGEHRQPYSFRGDIEKWGL